MSDSDEIQSWWCYDCDYDFDAWDDNGYPACPRCDSNEAVECDDGRS